MSGPKLYRRCELYNQPEVSPQEAAQNAELARQFASRGQRTKFNRPVRPRPAQRGVFPVSRSTFDEMVRDGRLPKPTGRIGRTCVWSAEVIEQKLAELGIGQGGA